MDNRNLRIFSNLCEHLDDICHTKNKNEKREIFNRIFNAFRDESDDNIFAVIRLLLPHMDKERGSYGIKEHRLSTIVSSSFKITKDSYDYKRLFPQQYPEIAETGDYSEIVSDVLMNYITEPKTQLTINEINDYLTRICNDTSDAVKALFVNLTPLEIKWIVRIILKETKFGLSSDEILQIFRSDAIDIKKRSMNLKFLVEKSEHADSNVILFQAAMPMLALKANPKLLSEISLTNRCVEEKYDGERFQFHYSKDNSEFRWFSRAGNNYNPTFESLTRKIEAILPAEVYSFIFDGEMIGFDKSSKQYGAKGFNYDIKKATENSKFQPCYIIFDVLYHNGVDVLRKPLNKRKQIIDTIIKKDIPGVILKSRHKIINGLQDLVDELNYSVAKELEGIVVKDPLSYYGLNERTESWIKVKAEYFESLLTELDLLIIGGYYGKGKSVTEVCTFLLAVSDRKSDDRIVFLSCTRSSMGLTHSELHKLQRKLRPHWNRTRDVPRPLDIEWGKDKPDVWIHPKNSVVLEMKGSELHRSGSYKIPHTLRFPRIIKVRYDKPWYDCLTLQEYMDIVNTSSGPVVKLFSRMATIDDLKIKKPTTVSHQIVIPQQKSAEIIVTSNKLQGKEFVVLSGTEDITKNEFIKLIKENGGKVSKTYKPSTFCALAGVVNFNVETELKLKNKNVIKAEWLLRQLDRPNGLLCWLASDVCCMTEDKKKEHNRMFDRFGDSYTQKTTFDSVKTCLDKISDSELY